MVDDQVGQVVERADHVEVPFAVIGEIVGEDSLASLECLFELDHAPGAVGELFGDKERLCEKPLQPAGPGDDQLVLLGKFLHPQHRDDVGEVVIGGEGLPNPAGNGVVALADHVRSEQL